MKPVKWKEAKHSFEIKTAGQFLRKLEEDYDDFRQQPLSSRRAINCALTAWHLREWFWAQRLKGDIHEQKRLFHERFATLREFDAFLRNAVPEFEILQAISNGSKHFESVGSVTASFSYSEVVGEYKRSFGAKIRRKSPALWVSMKQMGRFVRFDEVLKQVLVFWQSKLESEPYGWGVRPISRPIDTSGFARKRITTKQKDEPVGE